MQSKLLINLLALVALMGLTVVATVIVIPFGEHDLSVENNKEIEKLVGKNAKLLQESELFENELIGLKEKKAFLEGSISRNEKSSSELSEIILLLDEKRGLLASDVEMLESKKAILETTVSQLVMKGESAKELTLNQVSVKTKEVNNLKKLLVQLGDLRKENAAFKRQIETIKSTFEAKVVKDKQDFLVVKSELTKNKNSALVKQDIFEKEIKDLSNQIQVLILENKQNLDLANKEKEVLIEQFKLEKNALTLKSQNKDEIENLKSLKTNFEKLNGLRVIFSGNMMYDEASSQIFFQADNSIGIPIFQDDFTGSIAGKCGLPIDKEIANRCSATIIAEFVVENSGLFLRGKEIVEVVRK
jgi:hypothetical protein